MARRSVFFLLLLDIVPFTARDILCSPVIIFVGPHVGRWRLWRRAAHSARHDDFDPLRVSGRKHLAFSEISFSFGRLGGQNMTGIGGIGFELSRPGFSEALCRASVGLDFWHLNFSANIESHKWVLFPACAVLIKSVSEFTVPVLFSLNLYRFQKFL